MANQTWGKGKFKKGTMAEVGDHLLQKAEDHVRTKMFSIFRDTIVATPVDTGRLRNNWNTSLNSLDTSVTSGKGSSKIGEAKAARDAFELGDTFFFSNNLPYASAVEFGGYTQTEKSTKITSRGFLKQAPAGMLRISIRNHV
mgnify:CR=1 FL=1